jgi:hypothetical protein
LRFFLGAEAAGFFVVERGGPSASLMSELLFAVIGADWELAGMGAGSSGIDGETGAQMISFRRAGREGSKKKKLKKKKKKKKKSSEPRVALLLYFLEGYFFYS